MLPKRKPPSGGFFLLGPLHDKPGVAERWNFIDHIQYLYDINHLSMFIAEVLSCAARQALITCITADCMAGHSERLFPVVSVIDTGFLCLFQGVYDESGDRLAAPGPASRG